MTPIDKNKKTRTRKKKLIKEYGRHESTAPTIYCTGRGCGRRRGRRGIFEKKSEERKRWERKKEVRKENEVWKEKKSQGDWRVTDALLKEMALGGNVRWSFGRLSRVFIPNQCSTDRKGKETGTKKKFLSGYRPLYRESLVILLEGIESSTILWMEEIRTTTPGDSHRSLACVGVTVACIVK